MRAGDRVQQTNTAIGHPADHCPSPTGRAPNAGGRRLRRVVPAALAVAILAATAAIQPAIAQGTGATHQLDIPSQDLSGALQQLALTSQYKLLYRTELVAGKRSPRLKGEYTTQEALHLLLQGSGLTFRVTNGNTILVEPTGSPSAAGAGEQRNETRLAQATPPGTQPEGRDAAPKYDRQDGTESSPASARPVELETMVVTGTHIRGGAPIGAPVQFYDRETIERSGYGSTEEFMRSLPANFGSVGANTGFVPDTIDVENNGFGSAVNLRGLGSDATLVLLDGTRIAPGGLKGAFIDISFIPLSLIERVEVLGDGASAIYGSDAVAGVVNYVLREDFDGAETTVRLGTATQGEYDQANLSQAYGKQWHSGGMVLAYGYAGSSNLAGSDRDFSQGIGEYDLIPEARAHSAFANVTQQLSDAVDITGRAIYTDREVDQYTVSSLTPAMSTDARTRQFVAGLSADIALANDWQGRATGSHSWNSTRLENLYGIQDGESTSSTLGFKADGPLASLPGGKLQAAFGAEYRREEFQRAVTGQFTHAAVDRGRNVKSAYTELNIPLVGDANARPGLRRLAVSIAGRYEDYSDFGDTANPKLGVEWSPAPGLTLRGTAGTSFKAPLLVDLYGGGSAILINVPDPASSTGTSTAVLVLGSNADLESESSRAWTAGFDWRPPGLPGLSFGLTYFDISYKDRIEQPAASNTNPFGFISRPDLYGPFILRDPSMQAIEAILADRNFGDTTVLPGFGPPRTLADVTVIGDMRLANLAATDVRGVDFDLGYALSRDVYDWTFNLAGTYLLEKQTLLVDGLPPLIELDTLFNPVDLRLTASAGVRRDKVSANLALNYTDAYRNDRETPPQKIDSWLTVNLQLRYDYRSGHVSLGVTNLLDEAPPFVRYNGQPGVAGGAFGYDAANASPIGRFVSLQLTHRW